MTALNHALTGAIVGLTISNPVIAIIAALLSHFICDALPHYGSAEADNTFLKSRRFKTMLVIDAALCSVLVLILAFNHPAHWILAAICAFVATSPDFAWLPGFLRVRQGKTFKAKTNLFTRFASRIQWFQRPIGGVVELAWFVGTVTILVAYL